MTASSPEVSRAEIAQNWPKWPKWPFGLCIACLTQPAKNLPNSPRRGWRMAHDRPKWPTAMPSGPATGGLATAEAVADRHHHDHDHQRQHQEPFGWTGKKTTMIMMEAVIMVLTVIITMVITVSSRTRATSRHSTASLVCRPT